MENQPQATAVAVHHSATSDGPWDGPANEKRLKMPVTGSVGKNTYAWYDSSGNDADGDGYPDAKADWRFIHHEVAESGNPGPANVQACRSGISVLNGAQKGTTIPARDRKGVYDHLAKHLTDAGLEPAPLRSEDDLEVEATGASGRSAWALAPDVLADVRAFVMGQWSDAQVEARVSETLAASSPAPSSGGGVAIIPLVGVLTPRPSLLSMLFGGGRGLQAFREDLAAAANDPRVETIVLNIDSPGGQTYLISETAAEVRQAAESKQVIAVANTRIASGAYWIASQADEIVVTPSGDVGSIGVLVMHEDVSKAEEMAGFKTTVISAGKYKAEGHPFEPLSDEARGELQKLVDDIYVDFVADVAQGRGTTAQAVRSGYGQGRLQLANDAVASGLADRVDTIDSAIEQLGAAVVTNEPEAATTRQAVADLLLPS